MREKKRRQHHVWQHHLSAWATDGNLWCQQDGRRFQSSPVNLAVESEYYRIQQLDERDKKVLRWLCMDNRSPFYADLAERALSFLEHPYDLLARMRALFPVADAIIPIDVVEVNYVEDFYSLVEGRMCPILDRLRAQDLSSASRSEESQWLALFLATQFFRTKGMEHRLLSILDADVRSMLDCNWTRVWSAMRVIFALQLGASIHDRLEHAGWTIMESPSGVELITSDQPLFNIKSYPERSVGLVQEFAIYFPVTPAFALLCDLSSTAPGVNTDLLTEVNARNLNRRMAHESFRQVFARRSEEFDFL